MATERIQRRIDLLLDEADQAVANSEWELVLDRAKNVLAFDPENQDALAFLTAAERALGGLKSGLSACSVASSKTLVTISLA